MPAFFSQNLSIPMSWLAFEESSFRICFKNSLSTSKKEKEGRSFPLHAFPVAGMLRWFLYYSIRVLMNLKIINNIWLFNYFIITRNDFVIMYECNFLKGHYFVRWKWFYCFPKLSYCYQSNFFPKCFKSFST